MAPKGATTNPQPAEGEYQDTPSSRTTRHKAISTAMTPGIPFGGAGVVVWRVARSEVCHCDHRIADAELASRVIQRGLATDVKEGAPDGADAVALPQLQLDPLHMTMQPQLKPMGCAITICACVQ